jgi:type VI secretion system protein ImpF
MARTEIERTVQPSLLDRLTDLEPDRATDAPTTREASAVSFRASVQRDVEWLLNTRRSIVVVPPSCPEVRDSVHEFGLPDTTGIPVGTTEGRHQLLTSLQDSLTRFEPRLANPRVKLGESEALKVPQLRFSVEATLRMDPNPEQVMFDTVLEVASGEYEVRETGDA